MFRCTKALRTLMQVWATFLMKARSYAFDTCLKSTSLLSPCWPRSTLY